MHYLVDTPYSICYIEDMDNLHMCPPIKHIPTKSCSVCGIPALGGHDYCIAHLVEYEQFIGESSDWAYTLMPKVSMCARPHSS